MHAIETVVDLPLPAAEAAVREALGEQGFGVLTEIDVAATLKAKLGVDRPPLKILGACNPQLAHQALEMDPSTALVLPCNVVLEAAGDSGTRVAIADPRELMPSEQFSELAGQAATKLDQVARKVAERSGQGVSGAIVQS